MCDLVKMTVIVGRGNVGVPGIQLNAVCLHVIPVCKSLAGFQEKLPFITS